MTNVYILKTIVALPEQLSLPKIMYEMSNILDEGKEKESIIDDFSRQKNILEYHLLEARQMGILKQLKKLKQHVEFLCVAIRLSNTVKIPLIDLPFINRKIQSNKNSIYGEIVINTNPTSPPYSILALHHIWKNTKFNIVVHQHSIVTDSITNKFEEMLLCKNKNETIHNIDIKLIWKDVPDIQFITKLYSYPLEGEANLLRYLTRLIKPYNYEDSKSLMDAVSIDTILDLCLRLSYEESKNINVVIVKFAGYLSKSSWLLNCSHPSIADVALWSIIKQKVHNRIPHEFKNWYDLCEKTFLS